MKSVKRYVLLGICSLFFLGMVTLGTYIYLESKEVDVSKEEEVKEQVEQKDESAVIDNPYEGIAGELYNITDDNIAVYLNLARDDSFVKKYIVQAKNVVNATYVGNVYIETPSYKITEYANTMIFCDKKPTVKAIKEKKDTLYPEDTLSFRVQYHNHTAKNYNFKLIQDFKEIDYRDISINKDAAQSVINFDRSKIDFNQKADLVITDKYDNAKKVMYNINFCDYVVN